MESRVKDWEAKHPNGKIVIYGHADSGEKEPKALSERRAESVFAFITNDSATWDRIYKSEKWDLISLQHLMLDSGDYKGKHDIKLNADRFRKVAGNPWMGCAIHNKAKVGDKPAPENRRVAFILIDEIRYFPVHFPCRDGNESGCQSQCKKPGKRSVPGTQCAFYDELLREEPQVAATDPEAQVGTKSLKKGAKGPVVEELNIRLSGFGGGTPGDSFDGQTEAKVMQFQEEWMKEPSPSGIFDLKTAKALDAFASEFSIDIGSCDCTCGKCGGFGKGQFKDKYKGAVRKEAYHKYEYPGIHRSMVWALKGIRFHLKGLDLGFNSISSGYRCWIDNEKNNRKSTNHMGKAFDITILNPAGKKGGKPECDKVRAMIVKIRFTTIAHGARSRAQMEKKAFYPLPG